MTNVPEKYRLNRHHAISKEFKLLSNVELSHKNHLQKIYITSVNHISCFTHHLVSFIHTLRTNMQFSLTKPGGPEFKFMAIKII